MQFRPHHTGPLDARIDVEVRLGAHLVRRDTSRRWADRLRLRARLGRTTSGLRERIARPTVAMAR